MSLLSNNLYVKDLDYTASLPLEWSKLEDKSIMISGATGLIGSFLIDVLMYRNKNKLGRHKVIALGRNEEKAKKRFGDYFEKDSFKFISCDINNLSEVEKLPVVDYVFHAASNTHPAAYATDAIGTITTNIIGTYNLLEFASKHKVERFLFASTVEVYGENQGDTDAFDESYCGYIDCNTLRAGYPESKRAGEALCQAYIKQKDMDIVIPRLSRTYGPTMLMSDTKAVSQFIKNGLNNENIVLKSEGTQFYSYSYVADAVSAIFFILLNGTKGEAYNISDEMSDITLRDLAKLIADYSKTKVVFELPDAIESAGYSKATKAILKNNKLKSIGWEANYSMEEGIKRTIEILKTK